MCWVACFFASVLLAGHAADALRPMSWLWGVLAVLLYFAIRRDLGSRTSVLLSLCLLYTGYWYGFHSDYAYTNDMMYHVKYVRFLQHDITGYLRYLGEEHWHPPSYYMLAAAYLNLIEYLTRIDTFPALRLLSVPMFIAYMLYSLRTLRLVRQGEGLHYFLCCLLILFWPLAVLMGARISNDLLMYMLWSMFFFYLVRWQLQHATRDLYLTLLMVGLTFMVKTNAFILLGVTGCCVLRMLLIGQMRWPQLLAPRMWQCYAFIVLGIAFNLSRSLVSWLLYGGSPVYLGMGWEEDMPLSRVFSFDLGYYLAHPYITPYDVFNQPDAANHFLKTLLYGEFGWKLIPLAQGMNILLLAFIVATCVGVIYGCRQRLLVWKMLYLNLVSIALSVAASVIFLIIKDSMLCMDARFIFPFIVPLVLLYASALDALKLSVSPVLRSTYWVAVAIGFLLPSLGVLLYLSYYLL
jgi:hypothetical protein